MLISNYPTYLKYILAFKIKDCDVYPQSLFRREIVELLAAKWWQILK